MTADQHYVPEQIETERLLIRSPRPGDGNALYEAITESLDALKPWIPWAHLEITPQSEDEVATRMHKSFAERTDLPMFAIDKVTGEFVGGTGLHRFDWGVPRFEIGYWVRTRYAHKGYITEAVNGLTRVAFETLLAERVEIRMDDRNTASWRVAERAHFRLEGILRNNTRGVQGELRDTRVYSMIRDEWERRSAL